MNPIVHGEVFVTEDGGEMDLDLGTYERFLDITVSKDANVTTGQIYGTVIDEERKGKFLGQCVQIIPHITNEIKRRIRAVANKTGADIVLVECGGTVGDIEGLSFYEAFRQIRIEEGFLNTLIVHVALVPTLDATGEQKSKPAQHSIQELRRIGLQPDVIIARSSSMLEPDPKRKLALFGSVSEDAVFCSPTIDCIYDLPLVFDKQGLGDHICERLSLPKREANWIDWRKIVDQFKNAKYPVAIAICGKYAKLADSYLSVNEALKHAGAACGAKVKLSWIETETFEEDPEKLETLSKYDGILVPGGFGSRGTEGMITAINYARIHDIPFLGICLGFQLANVEFARNVCGLKGANITEINPNTPYPISFLMPEQRSVRAKGATMRLGSSPVKILPNTLAFELYKSNLTYGRHRHRYEVNPKYWDVLREHGLVHSGETTDGKRKEILEIPTQDFFFATQYHAEFGSRPGKPEPAYYGFVKACLDKKLGKPKTTAKGHAKASITK